MTESQWDDATRRAKEIEIVCPYCTAANRPGAIVIDLDRDWMAVCSVCSHNWTLPKETK